MNKFLTITLVFAIAMQLTAVYFQRVVTQDYIDAFKFKETCIEKGYDTGFIIDKKNDIGICVYQKISPVPFED